MSAERCRVVALLAAYNEADILDQVLAHLIRQQVEVYVIDDGSSDDTAEIAEALVGHGVVRVERRNRVDGIFDWEGLLRRKEQLAAELDADWFIHHDADEFRESPWPGLTLAEALALVSRLGYNAVDFAVLDFRPVDDRFRRGVDVAQAFPFYEPAAAWDRLQIKGWRRTAGPVDLVSSGGHEAVFGDRHVCPVRFVNRHYPIRNQEQGERKIHMERKPAFRETERERGWHVQYDQYGPGRRFIWNPAALRPYDAVAVKRGLAEASGELERLRADLQSASGLVGELEAALAGMRLEVDDLHRAADRARADLIRDAAGAEARRHELEAQLRDHAARIDGLHRELRLIRESKSWRLTAPLRSTYGWLLRREAASPRLAPALDGLRPVSDVWGTDRGLPVDRYYIQRFLDACRADIRGRVLEVKDSGYTRMFGGDRVTDAQVLDVNLANPHATIVADLAVADSMAPDQFDCVILTQTLHIIYPIREALSHAIRVVRPGGVLLCTFPAVSRVNYEDGGLERGDYWRLTQAAVRQLFADVCPRGAPEIRTAGNVRVCAAFLYGLAAEDLTVHELDLNDPWFPLVHMVRLVKPA